MEVYVNMHSCGCFTNFIGLGEECMDFFLVVLSIVMMVLMLNLSLTRHFSCCKTKPK